LFIFVSHGVDHYFNSVSNGYLIIPALLFAYNSLNSPEINDSLPQSWYSASDLARCYTVKKVFGYVKGIYNLSPEKLLFIIPLSTVSWFIDVFKTATYLGLQ
jgi:hypothetical protein